MGKRKHFGSEGIRQLLGLRQGQIMECLWERGPLTPGELHHTLTAYDGVAYTTVYTELTRLLHKGLVRRDKRASGVYLATIARERFVHGSVSDALRNLLGMHGAAAIHGFVDIVADDRAAFSELERALKEKKSPKNS